MKILGIDYGTKRIGLAVSDENATLAFPKNILPNNANTLKELADIINEEKITEIVVGESEDFKGKPNPISVKIEEFILDLTLHFMLPVHKQKEFLTSVEARRFAHEGKIDAQAAALILQRYLDLRAQTGKNN